MNHRQLSSYVREQRQAARLIPLDTNNARVTASDWVKLGLMLLGFAGVVWAVFRR